MRKLPFDKYELYRKAVQSPAMDVRFFRKVYRELRRKEAHSLRENFCGTASVCAEWVKLDLRNTAVGVDLDGEPLEYGRKTYLQPLPEAQRKRVRLLRENVLSKGLPRADMVISQNFSYFLFKKRAEMKTFLQRTREGLNKNGLAIFDMFGGSQCGDAIEDRTRHPGFTYYWDQTGFDPVTNEAVFHIHFGYKGRKYRKVFTYDWRMWGITEMRELMAEVGFSKTHVYWEGTARDGSGNGKFTRVQKGEPCLSWICYIVAEK